jgi:RNA methyltransferase, TrmH family
VRDGRFRRSERRIVIEGPHLVAAALQAGVTPAALLATEAALERPELASLARQSKVAPVILSPAIFDAIVDAETPPGIAVEIPFPEGKRRGAALFLEGVQDPGNVGTIVRSAAAFGAAAVVLDRQCADPWSPKVLRAGMGGHFSVGIHPVDDLAAAIAGFKGRVLCATADGGLSLRDVVFSGETGWLFGAEGAGVSPRLEALAAERVAIPMAPGTDSLNVAAAAAICLYEAFSRPGARS